MKKRGAKHSRLAIVPLGMKRSKYEIDARMGLVALQANVAQQQHLIDLYVLAELCDALTIEPHIRQHCASIRRLCDEIHSAGMQCLTLQYVAMESSANLLLEWFSKQPNAQIARTALRMAERIAA